MKSIGMMSVVLMSLLAVGCSNEKGVSSGHTKSIQIQGKSPGDYFNQFLSRVEGGCEEPSKIKFRYLSSQDVDLGKLPNGNPVLASIKVYLRADQSYSADYQEIEVTELRRMGYAYRMLLEKKLKGSWRVEDERIVLVGLGHGEGLTYNEKEAVLFTFDHDVSREGLNGKSTVFRFPWGSSGEQSINEYCGIQ